MDTDTIRRISEEIAHNISYPWAFLAIQAVLMVVAAAAGTYFGSYLKERGKNLATAADFGKLQEQLSATTHMVETIKAEISQKDEWTNLRRVKLEEMLKKAGEAEGHLLYHRHRSFEGKALDQHNDPGDELRTIATLYFPEIRIQTSAFLHEYRVMKKQNSDLAVEIDNAGNDSSRRDQVYKKFSLLSKETTPMFLEARSDLDKAGRDLIVKMMGLKD